MEVFQSDQEGDLEVKLLRFLALELYVGLSASGSGHFMTGEEGPRQDECQKVR
jgi:hypothetical protein